jgi:hypothetical protein
LPLQPFFGPNAVWCVSYQSLSRFWYTNLDYGSNRLPKLELGLMADVTGWQGILARRHMTPPMVCPEVRVCSVLGFVFPTGLWELLMSVIYANFFSQNEGLSPSWIALSFDGFGSISWHSVVFVRLYHSFLQLFFGFPTFSAWASLVEMHIQCIKIGIVLVLHLNPWYTINPLDSCRTVTSWFYILVSGQFCSYPLICDYLAHSTHALLRRNWNCIDASVIQYRTLSCWKS